MTFNILKFLKFNKLIILNSVACVLLFNILYITLQDSCPEGMQLNDGCGLNLATILLQRTTDKPYSDMNIWQTFFQK